MKKLLPNPKKIILLYLIDFKSFSQSLLVHIHPGEELWTYFVVFYLHFLPPRNGWMAGSGFYPVCGGQFAM